MNIGQAITARRPMDVMFEGLLAFSVRNRDIVDEVIKLHNRRAISAMIRTLQLMIQGR